MDDFDKTEDGWFYSLFATLRDEAHEMADDLIPIMNRIRSSTNGRYSHPPLDGLALQVIAGIFGARTRGHDE